MMLMMMMMMIGKGQTDRRIDLSKAIYFSNWGVVIRLIGLLHSSISAFLVLKGGDIENDDIKKRAIGSVERFTNSTFQTLKEQNSLLQENLRLQQELINRQQRAGGTQV
ncbi:hypothetical protein MAR_002498 [Mya arenaria]|uniref:Endoplasmic reticulum transmembrane protein n=1 Tax=Mya arenaria TaxID=6604 RepID=A0ABY7G3C0_MYAAR|nr:hypothetical protein MAR_002498 [Mya arenaria]